MFGNFTWALVLVVILLLGGIATYLYFFLKGLIYQIQKDIYYPEKIVTGIAAVCLAFSCINIFSTFTIIMLHIVFTGMFVDIVYIILYKILKNHRDSKGYKVWDAIHGYRILPLLITIGLVIFGYFNMMDIVRTDYVVDTDKVFTIEEDGSYRVALIADLHYGISIDNDELQSICDDISAQNIDIVVLCGDITDESTTKQQMMDAFRILGGIKSKYGVFYVYGNHDIQNYSDNKTFTEAEHKQILEASGVRILRDEVYEINDEFVIAGRLDVSFERYTKEPRVSIDKLLENVDKSKFILTLDHQPNEYDANKAAGTDLILSGHTHAGQIWPANFFLELFKFNDGVYGMERDEDGFNAIITSGIAGWGYTIKTSSPAEYVIVDIK